MSFTTTTGTRLSTRILRRCLANSRLYATTSSLHKVKECDVVIVGGGPAGLALANALGSSATKEGLKVTLVEGGDLTKIKAWNPPPDVFSNRVVSLTNASQAFLQDIGIWGFVDEKRTCGVEQMQVWDGISDARIEFSADNLPSGSSVTGMSTLIENFNLQRALLQNVARIPEVEILQRTKVTSIESDTEERGSWPLVHLDNQNILRARLLVGADGFNSPVRSFAQIPSYGWAYNTQAIVATMVHPPRGAFEGPNTTAYQRFLPTGPIAFLPLTPTISSLVWSTKPALASALLASDPTILTIMINAAFRLPQVSIKYLHNLILEAHAAGTPLTAEALRQEVQFRERSHAIDEHSAYSSLRISDGPQGIPPADSEAVPPLVTALQPGTPASFPLRYNHAESYLGEGSGARTVLVGDAAHTVHPLAGQGLNLGLADVECLARCIQDNLSNGGDIGSYTALLPYSQERYLANHTLMSSVDKLHKLYSTDNEAVVWARSVGLEVLNELDTVKAAIMMTAGAQSRSRGTYDLGSAGWNFAGNAVEVLAAASKTVGAVKGAAASALGSVVSNLTRSSRP